jgi:hypothetical protein
VKISQRSPNVLAIVLLGFVAAYILGYIDSNQRNVSNNKLGANILLSIDICCIQLSRYMSIFLLESTLKIQPQCMRTCQTL